MNETPNIFSRAYWKMAAEELKKPKTIVLAAIMIALRVVIKSFFIPVGENLSIYFGFFVNALGAMSFGPVVAVIAAAITDTLGCIFAPQGPYFFPFIFVEILGSLIFALMLYRQKLSSTRVILSRFSVSFFCNVILNPALLVWYMDIFYGKAYTFFTLPRTVKNLILFPLESLALILFLNALLPALSKMGFTSSSQKMKITNKTIAFLIVLFLVSAVLVYFYYKYFLVNIK